MPGGKPSTTVPLAGSSLLGLKGWRCQAAALHGALGTTIFKAA